VIRPFLADRATRNGGGVALDRLAASEVHEFLLAEAARRRGKGAQCVVSALRSFLRFLHVEGIINRPLAQAVPPVAGWALAGLPNALEAEQVRALLASCDADTGAGRRDLAVLSLLVRLGLRGGEIAVCCSTTSTGAPGRSPFAAKATAVTGCRCPQMSATHWPPTWSAGGRTLRRAGPCS
jgi:site-specific recombinase XerC